MEKDYGRRICPGCGKELPEELHFCLYCMTRLNEDEAEAVVTGKRKKRKIIIAVLLSLALCLTGAAGYYFMRGGAEMSGAKAAGVEQDAISILAEQREAAKVLSEELSENIAAEVQARMGIAAGEDVLVVAEGDTSQADTNEKGGEVNPPGGETVPPSDGSNSEIPLAGWFIADIPQLLVDIKEEFQRQGVTAEIVTTYEEYQNSTLRKLGADWDAAACWDDFYLSYMPGRPCGEEYMEQQARLFVENSKSAAWDIHKEKPEIIAVVFDHYDGIDTDWDRVDDAREIWLKIYF